jgi:hypothetical protein
MSNARDFAMMIIADELTKIEPSLNLGGSDEMLLQLCYKDYIEYYRWLTCNTLQIASDKPDENDIVSGVLKDSIKEIIVEGSIDDMVTAIVTFVRMWWKKYKERVKLILETPKSDVLSMKGKGIMGSLLSIQEKEEMITAMMDTFIQNGEICMPRLLAENLLLRTLGQSEKPFWNPQDKINLMTTLKREAKTISYVHGVLMFIKPNMQHFLREWRDEWDGNKIV